MYLRTTFGWDLAGTLPLELFGLAIPGYGWLIMHFRLLRLIRVYKVFKQIDVHNNVLRVSQMLISFMFFAHCVGSIWWALGVSYFNVEPQGNPPGAAVSTNRPDLSWCQTVDSHPSDGNAPPPRRVTALPLTNQLPPAAGGAATEATPLPSGVQAVLRDVQRSEPVSYTHLTLPTKA